jgi:putative transposase
LHFLGLSTRGVSKALFFLNKVKRSHVALWIWIQKYSKKILSKRKRILEFIFDETLVKVRTEYIWIGVVRARKQANSRFFVNIQREKHVCC